MRFLNYLHDENDEKNEANLVASTGCECKFDPPRRFSCQGEQKTWDKLDCKFREPHPTNRDRDFCRHVRTMNIYIPSFCFNKKAKEFALETYKESKIV